MQRERMGCLLSARGRLSGAIGAVVACLAVLSGPVAANLVLTGNTAGSPPTASQSPCPEHGDGLICSSTLIPSEVVLISESTTWFKTTLRAKYPGQEWVFHHVWGGDEDLKGAFDVAFYEAFNDCPVLGAEIEVNFVPAADSLIKDVLWIQAVKTNLLGSDRSLVDDRALLVSMGGPAPGDQVMYGPFYPYQDEDEDPTHWQTSYDIDGTMTSYDVFRDPPWFPCPTPYTTKYAYFEIHAARWDDYFNADGTIVDQGEPGHNVWIYEGFRWGLEVSCAPEPMTVIAVFGGALALAGYLRRRLTP